MADVILVEISVTSPAGAASTLRFCDRAVRPFPPSDATRPNAVFDDRLLQPPAIRRSLFDDPTRLTPSLGVGAMTLANADHALDGYEGYAWGDVSVFAWTEGTPFSAAAVIFKGLSEVPSFPRGTTQATQVTAGFYDYRAEVTKPLQTAFYAGTNGVGGVLYEGAADGLKGRPKPLAWGNLLGAMIPAPQVNGGVQAYQLHESAIQGSELLFDRGDAAGYVDDGDFVGAAFDGANPAAAKYRTDVGRGLLKLNGAPVGQLAFGFKGDAVGGYVETAGPILARILAKAGVPGARIGASVAALTSAAVVGAWAGDPVDTEELLAFVAASVPAAVLPDRAGVWQAVAYGPPKGTADVYLAADEVIAIASDDTAPPPVGEVRVGWGKIWSTYEGTSLAPALKGTTSEERLKEAFRWAVASDATTKARLARTWRTLEITTALRNEADALALAAALQSMFALRSDGRPRRQWRVTLERSKALTASLAQTVSLTYPPLGIAQNFLLVGEEPLRPRRDQAIWTLWG